jgi:hypothetical protein
MFEIRVTYKTLTQTWEILLPGNPILYSLKPENPHLIGVFAMLVSATGDHLKTAWDGMYMVYRVNNDKLDDIKTILNADS